MSLRLSQNLTMGERLIKTGIGPHRPRAGMSAFRQEADVSVNKRKGPLPKISLVSSHSYIRSGFKGEV
jgi:hypothetical protein